MKSNNIGLYAISVALFISISAFGQYQAKTDYLDAYFKKAAAEFNIPSLSVGIVSGDSVIFAKSYGLLKNGENIASNNSSVYAIASLSKAFTTACLGMLVDEGKLYWNDKVKDHLPDFELFDKYVSEQMTILDLCSHRSGLATFDGDLLWYGTDYSREEIKHRIRYLPLKQQFRTEFGYQNIMYITAGELIEAVSGKSWDDFVKERIFQPLKMDRSYTSFSDINLNDNFAFPHLKKKVISPLSYDNSGATAAIHSNVNDMCKWIKFWLNEGKTEDGTTLLSTPAIREIQSQHTILKSTDFDAKNGTHFKGYGLGWFLLDYQGKKVIRHGGGLPGYISQIALIPEENLGMIILTNDMSSLPSALMFKIIDVFTRENMEERDWSAEFLTYSLKADAEMEAKKKARDESRIVGTSPSHQLQEYAGNFSDKMYGPAKIEFRDNKLFLELTPTKKLFTADLNHWHFDTFQFRFNDPFLPDGFITFESDSHGKITGFKIDLPNEDFNFYNLHFQRN